MKKMTSIKPYLAVFLVLLLLPALAAASSRFAVLPFQINADKDYTYLQEGIRDMLSSRLASPGKIEMIDGQTIRQALASIKGFSGDNLALMVGAKLQADYVLRGSITLLGDSVSIDTKVLDITGKNAPQSFFKQTRGIGEVIPQINLLATEINEKMFQRKPAAVAVAPVAPAPAAQPNSRMHPEKLLQGNQVMTPEGGVTSAGGQSTSSLNPGFVKPSGSASQGPAFWKSRNFSHLISGVTVADVNNDGLQETILATPKEIQILQFAQGRMTKLKAIKIESKTRPIALDTGDINGNGTPEIFVSSLNSNRNQLKSSVLEFGGNEYKTIVTKAPWYFHVAQHPDRGKILLGQGQRIGLDAFNREIVELDWKGAEYLPGERTLPGRRANLLGFALGDVQNEKDLSVVAMTTGDQLRVMDRSGKEIWTGSDMFGGSLEHLLMDPEGPGMVLKSYLPVRLRVADLENDGTNEVIAVRNLDKASRMLARQRLFTKGQIRALVWDGLGLTTAWETRQISGRIADFVIADFDNDGHREILCAVISKEGAIIGTKPKSALIAYELDNQ